MKTKYKGGVIALYIQEQEAPGAPGIPARWTSSAKSGVGTALSPASRVWFTLSHGIFNEVYYPRIDMASIRDLGLLVTDGQDFFSEEKRHTRHQVTSLAEGVPAYRLINTCEQGRYQIEKEILADPQRDVVLQWTRFTPCQGTLADYHLYALLAPHLGNQGAGNTAWIGEYKGIPMLFARRAHYSLALACAPADTPTHSLWRQASAGFVGISDGWQDISRHKRMTWFYSRATNGNVALTGEVDLEACQGTFVLALAFGLNPEEAGQRARSSLLTGFDAARQAYLEEWQTWRQSLSSSRPEFTHRPTLYPTSLAVLRTHEAKRFPGGLIASLSIPWGMAKGDDDLGGYHLVWPRDMAETAGALIAAGALEDARRALTYLQATQEADGHWPQNMWLDGRPYWPGIQLDETAFPILLLDLLRRNGGLQDEETVHFWPMVRRAAAFLVANGPVTPQDRWEEDPGYSPFTLAVEIAALLAAAELAEAQGEEAVADYLRETADAWNASIERWTYVEGTALARQLGVDGYYVRIAPPDVAEAASPGQGFVPIKNRPPGESLAPAAHIVSPDALALVRFGLRAPDDPRMVNTVRVIDALLKVETPHGPAWHRYNGDGYGEHEDGSPFDGTGVGRAWPLLTGERAHYELAAGRREAAVQLLHTLEAFAHAGNLLPEQIWDQPDIPERELFFGQPSGSAMPLVWAHAEYVKLCRSLQDGAVFDMPPQAAARYGGRPATSPHVLWQPNQKCRAMPAGKTLRLVLPEKAIVHWSNDAWHTVQDTPTRDTTLGVHVVDLPTDPLTPGDGVVFTFYWPGQDRWESIDYTVQVEGTG